MSGENSDIAYWRRRIEQTEALARRCANASIMKVHKTLAAHYNERLAEAEQRIAL